MQIKDLTTLEDLKRFLKKFFKNQDVKIYLFGSRARGDNSEFSDVDLAILSSEEISDKITILKELLEESNLPFKVDLIDLKKASYLKEIVKKEGIRWL